MTQQGPNKADLDALKAGAAMLLQAGNRVAALSLLWSAVAIDPTDLTAHRRLAATLANSGDVDGAAEEYARFIEFTLPLGDVNRALAELTYGIGMVGGHKALYGAAEKIANAVRELVPPTNAAIAPVASAPSVAQRTATPTRLPAAAAAAALPSAPKPRLLPKVPFRFCLHDAGAQHFMQLEGGHAGLVPDAVRILDRSENVVDERLCLPLRAGEGHGPSVMAKPPVAWVVVPIPNMVAAGYEAGMAWTYAFQARVDGEWLALDLVDTGCRLGRPRAISAS